MSAPFLGLSTGSLQHHLRATVDGIVQTTQVIALCELALDEGQVRVVKGRHYRPVPAHDLDRDTVKRDHQD